MPRGYRSRTAELSHSRGARTNSSIPVHRWTRGRESGRQAPGRRKPARLPSIGTIPTEETTEDREFRSPPGGGAGTRSRAPTQLRRASGARPIVVPSRNDGRGIVRGLRSRPGARSRQPTGPSSNRSFSVGVLHRSIIIGRESGRTPFRRGASKPEEPPRWRKYRERNSASVPGG